MKDMSEGPRPSGTVTFLFTDIEGSTKLWEGHRSAMTTALARHDAILRGVIADTGGFVFKTIGDAFCAAFTTAHDAVAAALHAQLALTGEGWPKETPIRVRMAIHTGAVESRVDDYFGQPLNRVARLLATGHGGQTLLSQTTYDLTRDSVPPGCGLRELGEHRLKDLGRPESVYQLTHARLPATFPPLQSLDNPGLKHNLPQQVTNFVGREKEMAEIQSLLSRARLLSITGSGGSGKSRLALQVAVDELDGTGDGVWLVELAPLSDSNLVPQTVANALGVKEEQGKPLIQSLIEHLKSKRLLLLLDNCEHLLDACARLSDLLIRQCPGVQILTTSRESLGIAGEQVYKIPSLSIPNPKLAQTPETLSHFEAVQLFIDRALMAHPSFLVTNKNAPALASLCFQLDGIPFAIELAAARVRSLSVEEIDGKLDQRFRLLTGGSRTALPRHQTLRALIDWSNDLLNEDERSLLWRLSVFTGGWTLEAAECVCAGEGVDDWQVLDLLTSLADKSLVVAEQKGGRSRYSLLETVRQYSRDRLEESGSRREWRNRHFDHMLSLAEEAEPQLTGPDQAKWLDQLDIEHDNLRAALSWSTDEQSKLGNDATLRVAGALWRFWLIRGFLAEGRIWLADPLRETQGTGTMAVRAKALNGAGALARQQGDYEDARGFHQEGLALFKEIGDLSGVARSLLNLGNVAYEQGAYDEARALYEENLSIRRQLGDKWGIGLSLNNLGSVALDQGDYEAASSLLSESLEIARALGDPSGTALALANLGNVAFQKLDYPAARKLFEESLTLYDALDDARGLASANNNLAMVAIEQGDFQATRSFINKGLKAFRDLDDPRNIAYSLEIAAPLTAETGDPSSAARIWGAAERLREVIGVPLPPNERSLYDRRVAAARTALGDEVLFSRSWQEGRNLDLEAAIERTLEQAVVTHGIPMSNVP